MSDQAAQARSPFLTLTAICKNFGTTRALKDMSLEIRLGEIIGLVGPNGAGKSTLIKVITGVEAPTSGDVSFLAAGKDNRGPEREYGQGVRRGLRVSGALAFHEPDGV